MTTITIPKPTVVSSPTLASSVRSEWIKLSSTRSPLIAVAIPTLLVAVSTGAIVRLIGNIEDLSVTNSLPFALSMVSLVGMAGAVIIGAIVGGSDFQRNTTAPTLSSQPHRGQFLAGKVVFSILASLTMTVAMIAVGFAAAALFAAGDGGVAGEAVAAGEIPDVNRFTAPLKTVLHLVLGGLFGTGLGIATRSASLAVSAFFALRFVELVTLTASQHWVFKLLPFSAGDRAFDSGTNPFTEGRFSSESASLIIFVGAIALLLGIGVVRTFKQDIA